MPAVHPKERKGVDSPFPSSKMAPIYTALEKYADESNKPSSR